MDGLLLKIANDLVEDFERNGLKVGRVRIKIHPRDKANRKFAFRGYSSGSEFKAAFVSILSNPNFLCSAGSLPVIENIELENTNLNFHNSYRWTNITETKKLSETVAADVLRNNAREKEVDRYRSYMSQRIDRYISDANKAVQVRIESYVDPCYVDAGYVAPQYELS